WDTEANGMMSDEYWIRIVPGQWRWRWDLNPRKGCPFTRFRGVRPRPLGDSTAAEPTRLATPRPLARAQDQASAHWPVSPCVVRRTRGAGPRSPPPGLLPPPRRGG